MSRNYTSGELMLIKAVKKTKPRFCIYCGKFIPKEQISVDHLIPISRGGETIYENLGLCHKDCNNKKDDMTYEEYMAILREEELEAEAKRKREEEKKLEKEREKERRTKTLEKYERKKERKKEEYLQKQERSRLESEKRYNNYVSDSNVLNLDKILGKSPKEDRLSELFKQISK